MPSDSLSRQVAQQTPLDTLELVWSATGDSSRRLRFPRTVAFGPERQLVVSDAERNSLFAFTPNGQFVRETTIDLFDIPYLIGVRGDTLVVLNVGTDQMMLVHNGRLIRNLPVAVGRAGRSSLLYGAASDTALYAKVVGDEVDNFVARINRSGEVMTHVPLPGPPWRHAGMLRIWGDSLLSLSGFRPVVDVLSLPLTDTTQVDSMALRGFDSPMLPRSRAFVTGEVSTAPLLTAAAAPAGNRLFVLNLRPGWLQVDTYDRTGQIQHRLTQVDSVYEENFYPRDIAVQAREGGYDIAVVFTAPEPRLALYRWVPSGTGAETVAQK
jgi:DNA-binding beta-propeller fold protein YncE